MNSIDAAQNLRNADTLPTQAQGVVRYSRGKDKYDNAPQQCTAASFDDFEAEVLEDRSVRKGLAFVCAPLLRGTHSQRPEKFPGEQHWRLKDYAAPRCFLPFDFDAFSTVGSYQSLLAYMNRYRGFGYTTASHTPEAPRARAILQASRPVTREEGILVGEFLQAQILGAVGADTVKFDGSVYRGEHPVYTPVVESEVFHFPGIVVDVDRLLHLSKPQNAPNNGDQRANPPTSVGSYATPERIEPGKRNIELLRYCSHLRGKGTPEELILAIARDFNRARCVPPLPDSEVVSVMGRYPMPADDDPNAWPEPADIKESLPPVRPFNPQWLPNGLSAWVLDIADRLNCPVDFPAVAMVTALGSALGSRIYVKPYGRDTWKVPANVWAALVAPPGAMKSPVLREGLRPLVAMDRKAADVYALAKEIYTFDKAVYDNQFKKAASSNGTPPVPPKEPQMTRYLVNDTTYEMLVVIAAANPSGILVLRDELAGWFHSLEKDNQKEARGLYLTGWNGTDGYATDRIGRGHVRADQVVISLLGSIQPNVLRGLIEHAVSGGTGDDGLIQRFQLMVYPDISPNWYKVDRRPDHAAEAAYAKLIDQFTTLDCGAIAASFEPDGTPYLSFSAAAQDVFDEWQQNLENRIRAVNTEEHPVMLAHLGKYRSLFPKLALILHLADGGVGPIAEKAAARAYFWVAYLESHARRIYHTATNRTMQCAATLASKIKADRLSPFFTRSDVLLKEWANLRKAEEVGMAVTVLCDMGWLSVTEDRSTGGRPAERFHINPKVKRAA